MPTSTDSDYVFLGNVNMAGATSVQHKAASVTNADIAAGAGIDYSKVDSLAIAISNFALAIGATPVAREEIVHTCRAAGTMRFFYAGLNDTGTSTSVTYDLKKNGTTMLSAVVTVAHTDSDRQNKQGTLSVTTVAAGDVISMQLAVSSSTGAQGPFSVCGISYESTPS